MEELVTSAQSRPGYDALPPGWRLYGITATHEFDTFLFIEREKATSSPYPERFDVKVWGSDKEGLFAQASGPYINMGGAIIALTDREHKTFPIPPTVDLQAEIHRIFTNSLTRTQYR